MISISYLMSLPGPRIKVGKLGNKYHVPHLPIRSSGGRPREPGNAFEALGLGLIHELLEGDLGLRGRPAGRDLAPRKTRLEEQRERTHGRRFVLRLPKRYEEVSPFLHLENAKDARAFDLYQEPMVPVLALRP